MENFDIVIIGAGPGGYVAAIRASQLGKKVVLIEKEHLGGVCLNWGCIPTKALLRSAEVKHLCDNAASFGIEVSKVNIDLDAIVKRSRKVSGQLSAGIKALLQKNKITVIMGSAILQETKKEEKLILIKGEKDQIITAKNVIIATGARAKTIPNLPNHKNIWYAKQAMVPEFLPKSLLIIGSGAIGIEFASFYQTMGSQVTVVEMQPHILPQEDIEISEMAKKALQKAGIQFFLSSAAQQIVIENDQVKVKIKDNDGKEQSLTFNAMIVAVGITGNIEDLGLEKTKIKLEKGQIQVNEWCETDESGIYAIGDVAGAPWLAHKASHEGVMVAEKISGIGSAHPLNKNNIPSCTYSIPQIASVGLTEEKAKTNGYTLKIGRFPYRGNGKAIALGETEGMIKTIFDAKTGELLGAHMIGAEVTELIHSLTIAKALETTETELMHTIFPHPTLSEMLHESVLDAYNRAIHY